MSHRCGGRQSCGKKVRAALFPTRGAAASRRLPKGELRAPELGLQSRHTFRSVFPLWGSLAGVLLTNPQQSASAPRADDYRSVRDGGGLRVAWGSGSEVGMGRENGRARAGSGAIAPATSLHSRQQERHGKHPGGFRATSGDWAPRLVWVSRREVISPRYRGHRVSRVNRPKPERRNEV